MIFIYFSLQCSVLSTVNLFPQDAHCERLLVQVIKRKKNWISQVLNLSSKIQQVLSKNLIRLNLTIFCAFHCHLKPKTPQRKQHAFSLWRNNTLIQSGFNLPREVFLREDIFGLLHYTF